jgi:hypothetical protein
VLAIISSHPIISILSCRITHLLTFASFSFSSLFPFNTTTANIDVDFSIDFEFFKEIKLEGSVWNVLPQSIQMKLNKKEEGEEFWPRLTTDKIREKSFVSIDWDRYVDEDEQDGDFDDSNMQGGQDMSQMMGGMGGMGGMPGMGGMGGMPGMGGGAGGMPDLGGMDQAKLAELMAQMGGGGAGGAGGMPDMASMMAGMGGMGGAGGMPGGEDDDVDSDDGDDDLPDLEPSAD